MDKWEYSYNVRDLKKENVWETTEEFRQLLNERGSVGWELINSVHTYDFENSRHIEMWFKRKLES